MNEDRLIVTTYRPGQQWLQRGGMFLVVLVALLAGYLFGGQIFGQAMTDKAGLAQQVDRLQGELAESAERITRYEVDLDVERAALEEARKNTVLLQTQIYRRDEELKLYRDLLRDGEQPNGLSVSDVKFYSSEDGRVRYRWVARQKTNEVKALKVYANLWLIGMRDGQQVEVPLSEMDEEIAALPVTMEVRYFIINQGMLALPEGFEPAKMRISLRYSWMKEPQYSAEFDWKIEE